MLKCLYKLLTIVRKLKTCYDSINHMCLSINRVEAKASQPDDLQND